MTRKPTALKHLTIWILYTLITLFVYAYKKSDWLSYAVEIPISHIISACIFYFNANYILPEFLDKKRYAKAIAWIIFVLGLSIIVRFVFAKIIAPDIFHVQLNATSMPFDELVLKFFYQWFIFFFYSLGYWQSLSNLKNERELAGIEFEKAQRERLELENRALRAQINPHFIFNTLDPLRAKTAELLPEVSKVIGSFMEIIRLGITKPDEDGKVPITIEIAAIEGTINIYKQRFPKLNLSHVSRVKDEDSIRIIPHILHTFVENAFKHGVLDEANSKLTIDLDIDSHRINLRVSNKIDKRIKDQSHGIGLMYIKRHLESGYRDKYNLKIEDNSVYYIVDLKVQLN